MVAASTAVDEQAERLSGVDVAGAVTRPESLASAAVSLDVVALRSHRPARARVERRLGRLLRLLRDGDLFRALGFVRHRDYLQERLGLSLRSAQEMMRVDAQLSALPLLAAAYAAGEITSAHVRALTRVASPESEAFWLGLARKGTIRDLSRAVSAWAREQEHPGEDQDETGDLERLEIPAPAWVAGWWRDTVALVRRLAGRGLAPGECIEMILAEMAGADFSPPQSGEARPGENLNSIPAASSGAPSGGTGVDDQNEPGRDNDELHLCASIERGGCSERNEDPGDARAVDRELRLLVTERQRQDALLADHLRLVGGDRGYRDLGYPSLEEYALDRFGISPRSLYYLLALGRSLRSLPALRREFLAGRLTASQTVLVGSVATVVTAEAWMRRAERVTLRRLEDEVAFWRHLRETRPAVWERLEGGPLPEGVVLVPGQPPRLHACAPSERTKAGASLPAAELLRLLEADEAATPLPARACVIHLRVEREVKEMWLATLGRLRVEVGGPIREWEALALVLREFWRVWDNVETRRQRRENPTLERDGWRCLAPGCGSIGNGRLQEHHIVFRSAGGTDDAFNTISLCVGHHIGLLHEGMLRCSGRAPDELMWELGVERGAEPFMIFEGDVRLGGAARA